MHHENNDIYFNDLDYMSQTNPVASAQAGTAVAYLGYELGKAVGDRDVVSRRDIMKFNHDEAVLQRQWQEKMWHMQNGYNHPANQKARMIAAGLNPYAEGSVGSIPAGSAGTSVSAQAGVTPSGMDIVNSVLGIMGTMAEIKKVNSEVESLDAGTQETYTKIEGLLIDIASGKLDYEKAVELFNDFMEEFRKGYSPTREKRESEDAQQARDFAAAGASEAAAEESKARISLIESQKEYNEALTQTENELREGRVTEQTAKSLIAMLEYNLEQKFGYKTRAMSYEQLKQEFQQARDIFPQQLKELRNKNALLDLNIQLQELMKEDFEKLPPRERFAIAEANKAVTGLINAIF